MISLNCKKDIDEGSYRFQVGQFYEGRMKMDASTNTPKRESRSIMSLDGRMNRRSFLVNHLILYVLAYIVFMIMFTLRNEIGMLLFFMSLLLLMWRGIVIDVRRLHDFGKSGWWVLFIIIAKIFVPYISFKMGSELGNYFWFVADLVLAIYPGDLVDNQYDLVPEKKISF